MASYFSVISVVIRPEIKEKVSVGLLLIGEGNFYLGFSKHKIDVIGQLLPADAFRAIKFSMKNFQQMAIDNEAGQKILSSHFTVIENLGDTVFSQSYLSYLSHYKNNLLTVSEPNTLTISPTQAVFDQIFKKLVDEQGVYLSKKNVVRSFSRVRESAILRERFNYDFEVTQSLFPNLIVPVKIDLVGENGTPTFIKLIDLERRKDYVANDVSRFNFVRDAVPQSQRFIVSKEPQKVSFPDQHQIWQNLRSTSLFDYVDIDEVERLEEYAELHNVNKIRLEE
jgi:hypothetical protein